MSKKMNKKKLSDLWTSISMILFALAVLWNQASGNQYGNLITLGGFILAIIGIWRALSK